MLFMITQKDNRFCVPVKIHLPSAAALLDVRLIIKSPRVIDSKDVLIFLTNQEKYMYNPEKHRLYFCCC